MALRKHLGQPKFNKGLIHFKYELMLHQKHVIVARKI